MTQRLQWDNEHGPPRVIVSRAGAPRSGMDWTDKLLAAGLLAAFVGSVTVTIVLVGGAGYFGVQLAAEIMRRLSGAGR